LDQHRLAAAELRQSRQAKPLSAPVNK
jgi:hypothetical protein